MPHHEDPPTTVSPVSRPELFAEVKAAVPAINPRRWYAESERCTTTICAGHSSPVAFVVETDALTGDLIKAQLDHWASPDTHKPVTFEGPEVNSLLGQVRASIRALSNVPSFSADLRTIARERVGSDNK